MNNNSGSGNGGSGGGNGFNNVKPDLDQNAAPLTLQEEASVRSMLAEDDLDRAYDDHIEAAHRKMWLHFQTAAASLTNLYREREHLNLRTGGGGGGGGRGRTTARNGGGMGRGGGGSDSEGVDGNGLWTPFQHAAGHLTTLYRESWDGLLRPSVQIARKSGYQRARKELASWARSRRRCIRREELLAVLASMNSHPSYGGLDPPQRSPPQGQPLLGVEELLQAATVTERPPSAAATAASAAAAAAHQSAQAAAAAISPEQVILRSLKRPLSSPPLFGMGGGGGNAPQGRTTPTNNSDVNMSEHYSPSFKRQRHT